MHAARNLAWRESPGRQARRPWAARRWNHLTRRRLTLKVWVPEAGRLSVSGRGVKRVSVRVKKAGTIVTFSVPLTPRGMAALHGHGKKLKLRIGFAPKSGHNFSARTLLLRR